MFVFILTVFVNVNSLLIIMESQIGKNILSLPCLMNLMFLFTFLLTVPYKMLPTLVEGRVQARGPLAQYTPGLHPEGAHSVEASGAPAVKRPAATPQVDLQPLSNRLRIHLSSALSTCSPSLSKF